MGMVYSKKQLDFMRLWQKNELKRINLLEGSVSSGKTWISLVLWAFWVASSPEDKAYLMVGRSLTTLKRNCLILLEELVGGKNFTFSVPAKEGRLFGRKVLFEGANDARSEPKIRGLTLQGAYCDELTLFPEDFFAMLLSRLRLPGAKLFATTNPDSPSHWLKVNYMERQDKLDMLSVKFLLDDNDFLDEDYKENLKKEYTGVFYERFILGNWVVAEGLVYPFFDKAKHVVSNHEPSNKARFFISIDYGTLNPCSMGLWAVEKGVAIRIKEFYYDARNRKRQKTDEEYYADLCTLAGDRYIEQVVVDPSAASFITTIRQHGKFTVHKAKNDVLDGIRLTGSMIAAGRVLIDASCKDAIREFGSYAWNEKAGEDAVIKECDHAMDDIRYFCNTILKYEWR